LQFRLHYNWCEDQVWFTWANLTPHESVICHRLVSFQLFKNIYPPLNLQLQRVSRLFTLKFWQQIIIPASIITIVCLRRLWSIVNINLKSGLCLYCLYIDIHLCSQRTQVNAEACLNGPNTNMCGTLAGLALCSLKRLGPPVVWQGNRK
jgi:hypothetical protein